MRGAVLRDQPLAGQLVDLRHGFAEARGCRLLVARLNGFQHLLDRGSAAGSQRHLVRTTGFVLTRTLLRGLDIGQFSLPFGYRQDAGKRAVLFEARRIKSSGTARVGCESGGGTACAHCERRG